MIDFGALSPDINSARMYAGAGSSSLMTAASAWSALAAELNSAALGYENVVTQLSSEEWLGPASASMASAVTPYVAWMKTTAATAEEAATKASGAAAAFEQAFASVVPPPLIAANRATLAQAVATNVLGQNTGVIAQLEAQYGEMWAQDATAMYTYAGQSATATKVTSHTLAPQIADPIGGGKTGRLQCVGDGHLGGHRAIRPATGDYQHAQPDTKHGLANDQCDDECRQPVRWFVGNLVLVDRADRVGFQPWGASQRL